mmetsp:Transcript_84134/g.132857  ORF Transcript_84134/g.132857 Transcript_84134/m.132857 type:complete len:285 (+) Transcript_84134:577-1431(+)
MNFMTSSCPMGFIWRLSVGKGRLTHALANSVRPSHSASMPTCFKFNLSTIVSGNVLARCTKPLEPNLLPLRFNDLTQVNGKLSAIVWTSAGLRSQKPKPRSSIIGNSNTRSRSSLSLLIRMCEMSNRRRLDVEATFTSHFKPGRVKPHSASFNSVKCDFFACSKGWIFATKLSPSCGLQERSKPWIWNSESNSRVLPKLLQDMWGFLLRSTQYNTASIKPSSSMYSRIVSASVLALKSHICVNAIMFLSVVANERKYACSTSGTDVKRKGQKAERSEDCFRTTC